MALPSKKKQVELIEERLNAALDAEDMDIHDLASEIVDAYHEMLYSIRPAPMTLHVGTAFKSPFTTKVHHVAYIRDNLVWLVTADSRFGFLGDINSEVWKHTEETRAKAGEPGNNPEWKVGDFVSRNQRLNRYTIVATGDKCVLLEDVDNKTLTADSNDNMKKHYRKDVDW